MITKADVNPREAYWPAIDALPRNARNALPKCVTDLFSPDNTDPLIAPVDLYDAKVFVGLFSRYYGLKIRTDSPATLVEAEQNADGEVTIGFHRLTSIDAVGSCATNRCVGLQWNNQEKALLPSPENVDTIDTDFAYVFAANALTMLAQSGNGYDALRGEEQLKYTRHILSDGHHLFAPSASRIPQLGENY